MDTCTITHTNFQVLIYNNDCGNFPVVKNKCELIKYNNNYHVSLVENATGDPTLVSNTDFSEAMTSAEAIKFITCNCSNCPTYLTDVSIDGDIVTITRGDGSTFTQGISYSKDIKLEGFSIDGDTVTLTLNDGTELVQTINHPAAPSDAYIVDAVIDAEAGTVTYSYNDSSIAPLVLQIPTPEKTCCTLKLDNATSVFGASPPQALVLGTSMEGLAFIATKSMHNGTAGGTLDNGKFTAGVAGDYNLHLDLSVASVPVDSSIMVGVMKDSGGTVDKQFHIVISPESLFKSKTQLITMDAGDSVYLETLETDAGALVDYAYFAVDMIPQIDCGCGDTYTAPEPIPCATVSIDPITAQTVATGDTVTISAVASSDPDAITSYAWSQTGGTTVTLTGDNTDTLSFTAPADATDLTFSVVVTNACGNSATTTSAVSVEAPVVVTTKARTNGIAVSPGPECSLTISSSEPGADQNLCTDAVGATIEVSVLNDTLSAPNVYIEYVSGIDLGAGAYTTTSGTSTGVTLVITDPFPTPSVEGLSTYRAVGVTDGGTPFSIERTVYLMSQP